MTEKEEAQFKWLRDNSDILTESERNVLIRYNTELILAEYNLHKLYKRVRERLDREEQIF